MSIFGNAVVGDPTAIPNRITPGLPKDITNQKMTQYNDLRNVILAKPHILDAVGRHFTEGTGLISELLMQMKSTSVSVKDKKTETYASERIAKNIEVIGNHEFAWRIAAPQGFLYRIVETTALGSDGKIGTGGRPFYMTVNKQLGNQDDVFMLADGNTQVIIDAPPQHLANGYMRVRVKLLLNKGGFNAHVPQDLLTVGEECAIMYNMKPEASEHGSKVRIPFGEWAKNYMTTQRWEWDLTGLAAHSKLDTSAITVMNYYNGKSIEPYWIPTLDMEMMKKSYREIDNQLFWSKKNINPDGSFRTDQKGRMYFSGDGLYHQVNRRLKHQYNSMRNFDMFNEMLRAMRYDSASTTHQKPVYLILGGLEFRLQADRLIRNEFSLSPQVLFFDGKGGYQGGPATGYGDIRGIRSNFNYYETPAGIILISCTDYFDNRNLPTRTTVHGIPEQSYRGIVLNITPTIGGEDIMSLVSLAGRQNVVGKVAGMSNPGVGGLLTTPADVEGKHMLNMCGIALHNPNIMGEFRKVRRA